METLSTDFKVSIAISLRKAIDERGYADTAYLKSLGINKEQCSTILNHKPQGITGELLLRLSRKLCINSAASKWHIARTEVFEAIEEDIIFCQDNAKAMIRVDECGIGKTFSAKYLAKSRKNCFYVDASQGKSISLFTKILAEAIGLKSEGKYYEIKEDIKHYLKMIEKPIVIIDEAGDLGQVALQEIKEFWNATEGYCGWYLMGADGLKYIIDKGIKNRKPGFKEVFSRFADKYATTVPVGKEPRFLFYKKLITDVLAANLIDKSRINEIVKRCLVIDGNGGISGLRRAESLLLIYKIEDENLKQLQNDNTNESDSIKETEGEATFC